MTTTIVDIQPAQTPYEVIEAIATAWQDMIEKTATYLVDQKNIVEACSHLDQIAILMGFACKELIEVIELDDQGMPVSCEIRFRLLEEEFREEVDDIFNADYPTRIEKRMHRLAALMDEFFGILHTNYSATDEELSWYYAMKDGTFYSKQDIVELTRSEWTDLQASLEGELKPNPGLDSLFRDTRSGIKAMTHH